MNDDDDHPAPRVGALPESLQSLYLLVDIFIMTLMQTKSLPTFVVLIGPFARWIACVLVGWRDRGWYKCTYSVKPPNWGVCFFA
jgi:hypothetical protein